MCAKEKALRSNWLVHPILSELLSALMVCQERKREETSGVILFSKTYLTSMGLRGLLKSQHRK